MLTTLMLGLLILSGDPGQQKKPIGSPPAIQKQNPAEPLPEIAKLLDKVLEDGLVKEGEVKDLQGIAKRAQALKDRAGESFAWMLLARYHMEAQEYSKSIDEALSAIKASEGIKGLEVIIAGSNGIVGQNQRFQGKFAEAVPFFLKSADLFEKLGDKPAVALQLNNAGFSYQQLGTIDESLKLFDRAIKILDGEDQNDLKATIINNAGLVLSNIGQFVEADKRYQEALKLVEDKTGNLYATVLNNIALNYHRQGDFKEAIEYYKLGYAIYEKLEDARGIGLTLANIGMMLIQLDEYDAARECLEAALPVFEELKDDQMMTVVLSNTGMILLHDEKYDEAMAVFAKTLQAYQRMGWQPGQALALANLGVVSYQKGDRQMAIALTKQSVNTFQTYRNQMKGLAPELRESLKSEFEIFYRSLAQMLVEEGRLLEAEQVINMLKDEELFQYVQRGGAEGLDSKAALTPLETEFKKKYDEVSGKVLEASRVFEELSAKPTRTTEEEKKLKDAESTIQRANELIKSFLDSMATAIKSASGDTNKITELKEDEGLVSDLAEASEKSGRTAAITTVITEDAVTVILASPEGRFFGTTKIAKAELFKKINTFRTALRNENLDPRPAGKELYDLLIKPVEVELEKANVKGIIWSLDGPLRYVPVAALYDGSRYLIEKYQVSLFTPASRSRLAADPNENWKAASFGTSQSHLGFSALPGVPEELAAIQKVVPSTQFLDAAFTREAFLNALRTKQYSIVHVASHFSLVPGQDATSFLLLGDGSKLLLSDVGALPSRSFDGVELMTLSACQTAIGTGDGTELEGFAAIAQRKGVKTVMASLWPIDDTGTRILMEAFYGQHQKSQNQNKTECLRQAQLSLLTGEAAGTPGVKRGDPVEEADGSEIPKFVKDPKKPFSHPYFWAPFVLIGAFR